MQNASRTYKMQIRYGWAADDTCTSGFLWQTRSKINNVETSYFTQLKMCYLTTTFRCPSDILITS